MPPTVASAAAAVVVAAAAAATVVVAAAAVGVVVVAVVVSVAAAALFALDLLSLIRSTKQEETFSESYRSFCSIFGKRYRLLDFTIGH